MCPNVSNGSGGALGMMQLQPDLTLCLHDDDMLFP